MIRLCGAVFILAAGFMVGSMPLLEMRERIRTLALFIDELQLMKAELNTYGMSIPELMGVMGNKGLFSQVSECIDKDGPMAFSIGWKNCLERYRVPLTAQEYHVVMGLGEVLGRYALEEQLAAIDETVEVFMKGKEGTKNKLREVSRLYIGTSLSLSAMLVVMLL